MTLRKIAFPLVGLISLIGSLHAFQRKWREYPAVEYNNFETPQDYDEATEWVFARLMYPPRPGAQFDYAGPRWAEGRSTWTQDYPRADRHFLTAVRRLTFIQARSVEQPVNLNDDDDVFNYPFLYAVRTGEWQLTDSQVKKFREFIDRGGFFMTDDFWGDYQLQNFMQSFAEVFPDREVVDIPDDDQLFHIMYDLEERYQIPGMWGLRGGGGGYSVQNGGVTPYWRGVYDNKNRAVAVVFPNSDMGDSWEYADDPYYPEKYSRLGIRLGINAIIYAMTH
jgi:hypothetical protein